MKAVVEPRLREAPWKAARAIADVVTAPSDHVVIHSHQHRADFGAAVFRARTAVPHLLVSTVHARLAADVRWSAAPLKRLGYHVLARWALARTDLVFAVSRATAAQVREDMGLPWQKVVALRNAIDIAELGGPRNRATAREQLAVCASTRPVAVTVGKLEYRKGQHLLVTALSRIPEPQRPHLWLVGTGPWEDHLRRQVAELGLSDRVTFLGQRDDVPLILAAADIYVQPSLWDPLPRALLEAMALGVPSIASATDGIPEVIKDGETGWLVPPGDPQALACQIAAALRDKAAMTSVATAGMKLVRDNHTMDQMVHCITDAISKCRTASEVHRQRRQSPST